MRILTACFMLLVMSTASYAQCGPFGCKRTTQSTYASCVVHSHSITVVPTYVVPVQTYVAPVQTYVAPVTRTYVTPVVEEIAFDEGIPIEEDEYDSPPLLSYHIVTKITPRKMVTKIVRKTRPMTVYREVPITTYETFTMPVYSAPSYVGFGCTTGNCR